MKDCALYLPGRYSGRFLSFYKRTARGRTKIAVDGGYRFFVTASLIPDVLIGDLDSLRVPLSEIPARTEVIKFPREKDKTDAQLAVEYCLKRGARKVDIVQPTIGQPDHCLSNGMLLTLAGGSGSKKSGAELRIVNHQYEIRYLKDGKIRLDGAAGDTVSVIPLSRTIVLACRGMQYNVDGLKVGRGMTVATRNRVASGRAALEVRGEALLVRLYGRK